MQETKVQSLGWENPLEKRMAIHSSSSSLENPMDREAWQATIHGFTESDMTEWLACTPQLYKQRPGELERESFLFWEVHVSQNS